MALSQTTSLPKSRVSRPLYGCERTKPYNLSIGCEQSRQIDISVAHLAERFAWNIGIAKIWI